MIKLPGRIVNDYGQINFDENGLCCILLNGGSFDDITAEGSDAVLQFNQFYKKFDNGDVGVVIGKTPDESLDDYHKRCQNEWFITDSYLQIDVKEWLYRKCHTVDQIERVTVEYNLFEERDMITGLKFLIYLVDYMKANKIVWGVGRGSSVASYCLYLIGIHKIDSLLYELDIHEFLK